MKSEPHRVDKDQKKSRPAEKGDGEMSDTETLRELVQKKSK